jgi:1-acyl-sn-glycerol-3-phosphate acyltransferase
MERWWLKRYGYAALHVLTRLTFTVLFRVRVFGREHLPPTAGALVCSNHQSFLDPLIIGMALDRRCNYLARQSLFRNPLFKWIIEFLDAIPIDRDRSGFAGLRETLQRLKQQELVLIFPEGTRTPNGEMLPLKPGFCPVARRSGQPILPVAFDGAFQAWPRTSPLPQPAVIHIVIGEPISPELIQSLNDAQLVAELERRLHLCFEQARQTKPSPLHHA